MAEGRGGGRESAMQRVQIPRRRDRKTVNPACLLPVWQYLLVFVSPARHNTDVIFGDPAGECK